MGKELFYEFHAKHVILCIKKWLILEDDRNMVKKNFKIIEIYKLSCLSNMVLPFLIAKKLKVTCFSFITKYFWHSNLPCI